MSKETDHLLKKGTRTSEKPSPIALLISPVSTPPTTSSNTPSTSDNESPSPRDAKGKKKGERETKKQREKAERGQKGKAARGQKEIADRERKEKAAREKQEKADKAAREKQEKADRSAREKQEKADRAARKKLEKAEKQRRNQRDTSSSERVPSVGSNSRRSIKSVTQLEKGYSLYIPHLDDQAQRLFDLIENADGTAVKNFLNAQQLIDINCKNYKGECALSIAIKNQKEDVVNVLFQNETLDFRDAALWSVATGNLKLTATILDKINSIEPDLIRQWSDGSTDMSPLISAAQRGDFKMVRMLLKRGHTIEKPHHSQCLCKICKSQLRLFGSQESTIRLNKYKAICNPAYLVQKSNDPILYCFVLDEELKGCAYIDKEFKSEYENLSKSLRDFTVSLLSQCQKTEEIDTLMRAPYGFNVNFERAEFPRLQLAIDYHQKEFVAHSMVQQVLSQHWLGEFRSWPRLALPWKIIHVLMRVVLLPFICLALIVCPKGTKFLEKYRSPLNRFLMNLASYILFTILVYLLNYLDTYKSHKGPPETGLEYIVMVFVLGFIWSTIKRVWLEGGGRFIRVVWNLYDIAMEAFFLLTFIFWLASLLEVEQARVEKKTLQPRKYWDYNDSTLLHEGFLAVATVLTFGKSAYYFLQSSRLGPLQVSLGKMAVQIIFFLLLCLVIISAFAIPLTRMYAYYSGMKQTDANGDTTTQLSSFVTHTNSFWTLFWGMFGMSPVESTDVIIENLTEDKKNPVINKHGFTATIGLFLFATFELMMIIALVNTLIAILSNTFQRIIDNSDVEFKFARTKLWVYFFERATTLPSPFNMIPTLEGLQSGTRYLDVISKKIPGARIRTSWRRCCYIEYPDKESEFDSDFFRSLMSTIVQRYFCAIEEELEE